MEAIPIRILRAYSLLPVLALKSFYDTIATLVKVDVLPVVLRLPLQVGPVRLIYREIAAGIYSVLDARFALHAVGVI
jgi:hypothetical protein